ncbi:hypothetical protein [Methanofollis fontis]|uniref:Uncharacterized protein n=1 Tax=Methanofollis fontis TaxID=2052832 RepID=A0A483CNS2_9EURY|nr:hypothetical protein [Methanofollis fontis]TAJ43677.1 hypothetical protein CUJ86_10065 [Methanofollis fontis]
MNKFIFLTLVSGFLLIQASTAASTGSAEITTDTFGSSVDLTVSGSIADWSLTVGENEDTTSIDMTVLSNNADGYEVTVYDALDSGKGADSAGHMTDYTGAAYIDSHLTNALQIKSSGTDAYVSLSGDEQTIESKASASEDGGDSYDIGIKQALAPSDRIPSAGHTYRIIVTFVITAL